MCRNYYKAAITLYVVQLFLLAVLFNSILVIRFEPYYHGYTGVFEHYWGVLILILSLTSVFSIRLLYISGIRALRNRAELIRLKNIEEQNRIYRQHRHDLYNHLTVISGLAQLGKLDKLKDYLSGYLDNFNKSIITVNTGLKELDVLLYAKISEARDKGIDVRYSLSESVSCQQQYVIWMMTILANALDNAIKAAIKADIKKLDIVVASDEDVYTFEVANSYDQKIDLSRTMLVDGFTSKRGSKRGEGLSIIRKTVRRLQGTLRYDISAGYCSLSVQIPKHILEGAS